MVTDLTDLLDTEMVISGQLKIMWAQIENEWDLNGNSELFNTMQANYFVMLDEKELLRDRIAALSTKAA